MVHLGSVPLRRTLNLFEAASVCGMKGIYVQRVFAQTRSCFFHHRAAAAAAGRVGIVYPTIQHHVHGLVRIC